MLTGHYEKKAEFFIQIDYCNDMCMCIVSCVCGWVRFTIINR